MAFAGFLVGLLGNSGVLLAAGTGERMGCALTNNGPGKGLSITLTFKVPHPAELAVVRPDKEFFFIAQRHLGGQPTRTISSELFAGVESIKINTRSFQAQPWRADAKGYERVFTTPGKYVFVMANELESDDADSQQRCEVTLGR